MTVKELSHAVKNLIGKYDYFDSEKFISSARTALGVLFSEMHNVKTASVFISSPKVLRHVEELRHRSGKTESVRLLGGAYSLRLFGKGQVRVSYGGQVFIHNFDGWDLAALGKIEGEGVMEFIGDEAFCARNIAFFDEAVSPEHGGIPLLGKMRRISVRDFVPDFARALYAPTDKSGAALECVYFENDCLLCPADFSGEVHFSYKERAPRISLDEEDREISMSPEAEAALSLLTAAYMLGEEESEAAEMFVKDYKRLRSSFSRKSRGSRSEPYFDTTGWG